MVGTVVKLPSGEEIRARLGHFVRRSRALNGQAFLQLFAELGGYETTPGNLAFRLVMKRVDYIDGEVQRAREKAEQALPSVEELICALVEDSELQAEALVEFESVSGSWPQNTVKSSS